MATNNDIDLDSDLDSEFDSEEAQRVKDQTKELKKNNIKKVFGTGVGRLALICIVLVFLLGFGFGFYKLFGKSAPKVPSDMGNNVSSAVLETPNMQASAIAASEVDAQMRRQNLINQAASAQANGTGFIAPAVLQSDGSVEAGAINPVPVTEGAKQTATADMPVTGEYTTVMANDRAQQINALKPLKDQIVKNEAMPQILVALGRDREGKAVQSFVTGFYSLPNRTKIDVTSLSAAAIPSQIAAQQEILRGAPFISAGDSYYCQFDYGINTDAARNDVFATCAQGKLTNAKLIGKYDAAKDSATEGGVSVLFSLLSLPGKQAIPIQAIAIDDINETSSMADEVDEHNFRKYGGLFVASALRGFGRAASIITGSTVTMSNGAQAVTTTTTDPITTARQAKISAGEIGITLGDAFQKSSDGIKRTVKVVAKKGIRVVFLVDVHEEKK